MTAFLIAIGSFFKGIWNWYWKTATLKTKLVILAGIAGLCIIGYILWQNHQINNLHKEVQDQNFNRQMVNVDILSNQITNLEKQGNVLSTNTNTIDANRNASVNRDSSTFSGDSDDKFCRRYCHDSTCELWRSKHPDECR